MRFDVVTLFPGMFEMLREQGVTGRAHQRGVWTMQTWNPRAYATDVHRTVDDRPYGGGPGMVMMAEPLSRAVNDIKQQRQTQALPVILLSPAGQSFDQAEAQRLSRGAGGILVCGRYEGIDQRFIDHHVTHEISLGDFVLSGGEIAAMALMDSVVRLLPGVLGHAQSAPQDSFNTGLSGLLDHPHYTRPETWQGHGVPHVLSSGDHARIDAWRRKASLGLTLERRPDLIRAARQQGLLSAHDEACLKRCEAVADWPDSD